MIHMTTKHFQINYWSVCYLVRWLSGDIQWNLWEEDSLGAVQNRAILSSFERLSSIGGFKCIISSTKV